VEALGGMTKAVEQGLPKMRIEEAAARRQARIDRGEDVIVGVNRFRLADEPQVDILDIDTDKVRAGQVARLKKMRDSRDPKAHEARSPSSNRWRNPARATCSPPPSKRRGRGPRWARSPTPWNAVSAAVTTPSPR
jgi:methylmalonyl-CoA mutase N-terminal domain/subunit